MFGGKAELVAESPDREPRKALRGRFVRKQICDSKSVADLIRQRGPWAGLVFERMILHADDEGRFVAEPEVVKAHCLPWHDRSAKQIDVDLDVMASCGLVQLYAVSGTKYGVFPNWNRHQPKIRAERHIPSELPSPNGGDLSDVSSDELSDDSLPVGGADVEVEEEVEDDTYIAPTKPAPATSRKPSTNPVIEWYLSTREHSGRPVPAINHGKLARDAKAAETQLGQEEVRRRFVRYLKSSDPWDEEHNWGFEHFFMAGTLNRMGAPENGRRRQQPTLVEMPPGVDQV